MSGSIGPSGPISSAMTMTTPMVSGPRVTRVSVHSNYTGPSGSNTSNTSRPTGPTGPSGPSGPSYYRPKTVPVPSVSVHIPYYVELPIMLPTTNFIGAGILLYSYNQLGELVFLLGREFRPNSKSNHNKFSDFGGVRNDHESPAQTAIREFYEETLNLISIDVYQLKHSLVSVFDNYYMFIVQIPYDSNLPFVYQNIANSILISNNFIEKSEIKWLNVQDIIYNKQYMRSFFYYHFLTMMQMYFSNKMII
jgi:hypothetical protein